MGLYQSHLNPAVASVYMEKHTHILKMLSGSLSRAWLGDYEWSRVGIPGEPDSAGRQPVPPAPIKEPYQVITLCSRDSWYRVWVEAAVHKARREPLMYNVSSLDQLVMWIRKYGRQRRRDLVIIRFASDAFDRPVHIPPDDALLQRLRCYYAPSLALWAARS